MSAKVIDGVALADCIKQDVAVRVRALPNPVHLVAILVGATAGGELYARRQGDACRAMGIQYDLVTLPESATQKEVKSEVRRLNADERVTGIMMHLPLPPHLDAPRLQYEIDVVKDVEGVNPANIGYVVYGHTVIAPCTALSVIELIKSTGVDLRGAEATVVGASQIVGKPVALLLTEQMATVALCHIETKDLSAHTRRADILVVAAGKPGLIQAHHVREGAVVIDVGINRLTLSDGTKKTIGDIDFDGVKERAGYLTPVPGGVGPMTVAMLLKNTLRSAEIRFGLSK